MSDTKKSADEIAAEKEFPTTYNGTAFIRRCEQKAFLAGCAYKEKQINKVILWSNTILSILGKHVHWAAPNNRSELSEARLKLSEALKEFEWVG